MVVGMVGGRGHTAGTRVVTLILDTHFLIWLLLGSNRIAAFPWLGKHRPWGVSPVSLLEIEFLSEVGRLRVRNPGFIEALSKDDRFVIDDPPLAQVFGNALSLDWTRDPFDRLLAAHSLTRRVPLCSVDETIQRHYQLLPQELRSQG
jgi:PIN domain nuclease of toxin-antitoxin system